MTQRYLDISDILQQTAAQVQKDNSCTETYALIHAATRLSAHGAYDAGDVGEVLASLLANIREKTERANRNAVRRAVRPFPAASAAIAALFAGWS